LWALSNFAIEGDKLRFLIVEHLKLDKLTSLITSSDVSYFVKKESMSLLTNLMLGAQILPLKMIRTPLLLISRVLVNMELSETNQENIASILSIMITSNANYCAYIRELMIVVLGLREKIIHIFEKDLSNPISLAVVRLVGELCCESLEEAYIF
jgi:hypothetical protein